MSSNLRTLVASAPSADSSGANGFVLLGFPKCGTSALMRALEATEGITVHRGEKSLEAPFFQSDAGVVRWGSLLQPNTVNGHKFASYVYDREALRRMRDNASEALFIVCVRDPLRSLISWREMHRRLAERDVEHFVNRTPESKEFYASCSLSEYYRAFAGPRLAYAAHIRKMRKTLGDCRLVVVGQERFAADPDAVLAEITQCLGVAGGSESPQKVGHVARADLVEDPGLDQDIWEEINAYRADLESLRHELLGRAVVLW